MAADEPRGQVPAATPSWSSAALALAAVVVVATAVALLWYPAPRAAWSERLLAALLPTSLVLAAALRLVVWQGHEQDAATGEGVPRALLALAVGITVLVAVGGNAYNTLRVALAGPVLLVFAAGSLLLTALLLACMTLDLERLRSLAPPKESSPPSPALAADRLAPTPVAVTSSAPSPAAGEPRQTARLVAPAGRGATSGSTPAWPPPLGCVTPRLRFLLPLLGLAIVLGGLFLPPIGSERTTVAAGDSRVLLGRERAPVPIGDVRWLAVGPDGLIIASDARGLLLRLAPDGSFLDAWNGGSDVAEFAGAAFDAVGNLYVVDRQRNQVLRLGPTGDPTGVIDLTPHRPYGPNGVAVAATGEVFVADTGRNRILVFDSAGQLVRTLGGAGTGPGQFRQPLSLALDGAGRLYVTEIDNRRLQILQADGQHLATIALDIDPFGVALDRQNRIYVAGAKVAAVQVFDQAGQLLGTLGPAPNRPALFPNTRGVALSADGRLLVAGPGHLTSVQLIETRLAPPSGPLPVHVFLVGLGLLLALAPYTWPVVSRVFGPIQAGMRAAVAPVQALVGRWRTAGGRQMARVQQRPTSPIMVQQQPISKPQSAVAQVDWSWGKGAQWVGLGIAVACAARAVVLFRLPDRPGVLDSPFLWLSMAVALFGVVTAGQVPEQHWDQADAPLRNWTIRRRVALAACALGAGTILAYAIHVLPQPLLVTGWLAAQILWMVAFVSAITRPLPPTRSGLTKVVGLGALLAVAAWLRLWRNTIIPVELSHDMASYGLYARKLLTGNYPDFFGVGYAKISLIGFWPTAFSLRVFGDNLAGLNTWPAFAGVASLVALYLLTRELFGWRPALFATLLLTGDLMHLHYSRQAAFMDPVPFVAWSLYFLVRGLRHGRPWEFAASGLVAGYAIHMYFPGRLILPLAAVALAVTALAAPRTLWARRWGLAIAAMGLVLALGPTLVYFARHPFDFNERTQQVFVFNPSNWAHTANKYGLAPTDSTGIMLEQFKRSALFFWRYNDDSPLFPGINRNLLEPISGVLLMLGLGYGVRHFRRPAMLLTLVWLVAYVLTNAVIKDPPSSMRTVGLTLPVALLGGLALDRALALLSPSRRWASLALALGVAVTIASGARNWQDYVAWGTNPAKATERVHIARFLMAQPAHYHIRLVSRTTVWDNSEYQFLLSDRNGKSLDPDAVASSRLAWPDEPTIFILTRESRPLAAKLQEYYPTGRLIDGSLPPLTGIFYAFFTHDAMSSTSDVTAT